ncbi:MAG TPA: D-alanine--D-alanine ligase family protein [Polyangiaceae bacterium]|jgi:D-alanine-D-alanine ligase|nr:D-alanine--D-alanine ligase family protein [Polyangiaceae bacterium]
MTNQQKLRVAVLYGGRSAEHEISLLSARFVVESLDPARYEPVLVGITKEGRWLLQEEALLLGAARDPRLVKLNASMPGVLLPPYSEPSGDRLLRVGEGAPLGVDVIFPVLHGPMGEDGTVQGLLELSGVPYVGAGVLGSAVGMDKDVMKRLLLQAGLPVLAYEAVRRVEWRKGREAVLNRIAALGFPQFVKPANLGSSVGIKRALAATELEAAIVHAFEFDDKLVIERGLDHPREIECAVLGGDAPRASIPGEITIDHPDGFYSYDAKYVDEAGATTQIPARLSSLQVEAVQRLALATFCALECEGLARVDLFLSAAGELFVNEINTLPGFTAVSMFPKLWQASGVSAKELMDFLIEDALERAARRRARRSSM